MPILVLSVRRLGGNPGGAKFFSVPIGYHAGCPAVLFSNEGYLHIIFDVKSRYETGFAFRKNLFTPQATNMSHEVISHLIFLMRDSERWPHVDQPEKKCLSVLPDVIVVYAGINVDGNGGRGNVSGNSGQLDRALDTGHGTKTGQNQSGLLTIR